MSDPAITSRLVQANGQSFMVDECGGGDDVALFLHGFPESRYSWRYQLPLLASLGWRAVAPDLRGYGQSSRPRDKAAYRIEHLIADAAGLFDALGAKRRLLVAHDWGAAIAWGFAIEKARPLDGLVIMNVPHPSVFLAAMRGNAAQWKKSWYIAFFQLPGIPEAAMTARNAEAVARAFTGMAVDKSRFPPEVTDHYRRNALIPGAMTAMINYYRANVATMARWGPGKAAVIETPTLMLWGEEDAALGLELTEGYEGLVTDFTLRRFPGVSHWVQQEAPEAVNTALEGWLRDKGLVG
ncbi:pimeloyl-ACP methyl ester carboxylesterase [Caulobacter ginsengisoli]|uniref:Pimeloyl-ACP methyl ester carboxylesterase n=1 Tax=Caulobacter ginsengisoli TaxID=400775 RepID=A0ABU0IKR3_9CAUL|nr:alpha/beta hydrolase [Caulobacter ginsengisoli]MDQ0462606.1 pimeloyl-ACP methyl ester carboxylesterase [Caulobacter ginsengisoli]